MTRNDGGRVYSSTSFRPGTMILASDDASSIILADLDVFGWPTFSPLYTDGSSSSRLAWNADGSRVAYVSAVRLRIGTPVRYYEIRTGRYHDWSRERPGERIANLIDTVENFANNDGHPELSFGKMAWWGNKLIYTVSTNPADPAGNYLMAFSTSTSTGAPLIPDTTHDLQGSDPAVSPDGRMLAYIDGHQQLVTCTLPDTSDGHVPCLNRRPLTSGGFKAQPVWSPDGQWIFFVSSIDGYKQIAAIPSSGLAVTTQLTSTPSNHSSPAVCE